MNFNGVLNLDDLSYNLFDAGRYLVCMRKLRHGIHHGCMLLLTQVPVKRAS